jgi:predicted anti-sigma-YlaC factor YlaD
VGCDFDGCDKPVERRACDEELQLCAGHRKQWQRHGRLAPLTERPQTAKERALIASLDLRDADSEDDGEFRRAEKRWLAALRAAAPELLGWPAGTPPAALSPKRLKITRRQGA